MPELPLEIYIEKLFGSEKKVEVNLSKCDSYVKKLWKS